VFKVYDGILAKQKYIGGDEFTLGDIFHLSYLNLLNKTGESKTWAGLPNVERWVEAILTRPSWVQITS
jgi:glutathione S-transferase